MFWLLNYFLFTCLFTWNLTLWNNDAGLFAKWLKHNSASLLSWQAYRMEHLSQACGWPISQRRNPFTSHAADWPLIIEQQPHKLHRMKYHLQVSKYLQALFFQCALSALSRSPLDNSEGTSRGAGVGQALSLISASQALFINRGNDCRWFNTASFTTITYPK